MKPENFYTVFGWMVEELGKNEIPVYAIIYGFSQDGEGEYTGSLKYLCSLTKQSLSTVKRTLEGLVEKGWIKKRTTKIANVTFNSYRRVHGEPPQVIVNSPPGHDELAPQVIVSSNSKLYNKEDNINRFSPPKVDEIKSYMLGKGLKEDSASAQALALWNHYESNGWMVGKSKMKKWKAAVSGWIGRMTQFNPELKQGEVIKINFNG